MTRIDSAMRLAEIIQRQVEGTRPPGRSPAAPAAGRPAALAATIARRVRAVDRSAPDHRRQAFRVFLESVLLAAMGETVINDPAFYQLVEQVQARMAMDTELAEAMERAAQLLLTPDSTT